MKHSRINQAILLIIRVWMLFSLALSQFVGTIQPAQASEALSHGNPAGSLDEDFGLHGKVTTNFGTVTDAANAIAIQPDDKIVAAGGAGGNFALARYNSDGSLDTSFDLDGKVTTDFGGSDTGNAVAIQPDGKIIVAGMAGVANYGDFALARYNSNGSLDTSFGIDGTGKVTTHLGGDDVGYAIVIQSDGKIIVAGQTQNPPNAPIEERYADFALARYLSNGSLDSGFGIDGIVKTSFIDGDNDNGLAVALQTNGKIIVVGTTAREGIRHNFALARYNDDGSLDESFGINGKVSTPFTGAGATADAIAIQGDGKIVVAGFVTTNDFALARYNSDGSLDTTNFGTGGQVTTDFSGNDGADALVIQADGKIVVTGYSGDDFALARYDSTGSLDTSFGAAGTGKVTTNFVALSADRGSAIALQSDGRLVMAGKSDGNFALARYDWANFDVPDPFTKLTPANGVTTDQSNTVTLSWGASNYATSYEYCYSINDNDCSPATLNWRIPAISTNTNVILSGLTPNTTYYWHVRAINSDATTYSNVAKTAFWSFHTKSVPLVPVLISPTDNSSTTSKTPKLLVNTSAGTIRYQFQYSTDPLFGIGSPSPVTTTTTSYTTPALQYGTYYWRVRASNTPLAVNPPVWNSAWSVARRFGVTFQVSPVDNGYAATATPTFTWAAVTSALAYHLQVSKTDTFASTEVDQISLLGTRYTIPVADTLDYGTHYWRLRVYTPSVWSTWTPAWKFTLTPPLTLPPVLISPANAALLANPTLTWKMVMEDDRYEVQIDNISTFASPERTFISATGGLSYTASPVLPSGVYYWRVRISNYLSVPGPWSLSRSFTVDTTPPAAPVLSSPAPGASVVATPAFSWVASATATKYQFQYATNTGFTTGVYTSGELTTLTHTPTTAMTTPGAYYWRVQARDALGNWSAYSATRTVTILPAPVLIAPANALPINDRTPDFTWNPVASASTYQLQIAKTATFTLPLTLSYSGASPSYTPTTNLADGVYYWHVRAVNSAIPAVAGAWSAYRSFTIDATPPAVPVLSSPAVNASVVATPAFSWLASATATKYQFEYSDDSGFNDPGPGADYNSGVLTTLNHIPITAMTPGTYYWHVRAGDAAGNWSAYSVARTVVIQPAPTLTAPANALVTKNRTPTFTWEEVVSGSTYQLEISKTAAFTAPVAQTFTGDVDILTYTPTTPLTDGLYYWHVRAGAGAWSAYRTFTVDNIPPLAPVLSSPAAGALVVTTPAFSWLAAATATKYQFQYATNTGFTADLYTPAVQTTLNHTPPAMLPGTYYWHAQAGDAADNWSAYSATRTVTILPAPVLTAPTNALLINDRTPDFTWSSVGIGNTYQLQIAKTATFALPLTLSYSGTAESYTATTNLVDGVYYWHVRAVSAAIPAVAGAWSAYRSFTIDATPPAAPVLSSPVPGASVVATPAFSWLAAATATKYQFQYATDTGFSIGLYAPAVQTTLNHTPPTMPPGTYYWRVQAGDAAGNWNAYSAPRTVTILAAPVLTAPANALLINSRTPTFTWNPVDSASTYQLQIAKTTTFAAPLTQSYLGASTSYTPTTNLADGIYYWHVRAMNTASQWGTWSAYRSFTIDATPPAVPVLSSPAVNASVVATTAFSWLASATATKYQFQYATDTGFSTGLYTPAVQTTLNHTPPAMPPGIYYWHVQAGDAAGNWSAYSARRTVTILPAPVLTAPANALLINIRTPEFTWEPVGVGSTYQLQIAKTATFALPLTLSYSGTALTYIPTTNLADGVYYWHVRAGAGTWSAYRSFTIDSTPPAAPVLSAPANAVSVFSTPAFSWLTTPTATKYEFEYTGPASYTSGELTTLNHTPPLMAQGTYSWRVRARDAAINWGAWSIARTINIILLAPTLNSPANGSVSPDPAPILRWSALAGASHYQVQMDDHSTFSTPLVFDTADNSNFITVTPPDGLYYWRVKQFDSLGGESAWSAVWRVTINQPIPAAPILLLPANESTSATGLPTFTWNPVSNGETYQIQINNRDEFIDSGSPISLEFDDTAGTTSRTPDSALTNGIHYWQVRAINHYGAPGAWSVTRTLTIDIPPAVPTLLLPAHASTDDTGGLPTFTWNPVTNANSYQIQVDNNSNFSSPEFDNTDTSTNRTPSTALVSGIYSWRVRAINIYDTPGDWSETRTLTVDILLGAPTLTLPTNLFTVTTGTPTFEWGPVTDATSYQIQVANDSGFTDIFLSDNAVATTNWTPGTALTDSATYYWRVAALNIIGTQGAWSETRTLTVDILVAPTLTSPTDGFTVTTGTPTFEWGAVTDATDYQIQVANDNGFTDIVFTDTDVSTSHTSSTALTDGNTYYWRVAARNTYGTPGAWSVTRTLMIGILVAPTLTLPDNGSTDGTGGTPTFTWGAVTGATDYQIQVASDSGFASIVYTDTTATTSCTPGTALTGGSITYYWRVAARNTYGTLGAWSTTWTVIVP